MPNIRGYDAPQDIGLRPTEVGIDATARAAQRIEASYSDAASAIRDVGNRAASTIRDVGDVAVKYVTHQEVSHGAATFAQLQADLTDKWNQTLKGADPNDTSVAGRFNEEVMQPAMERFTSSFNTEGGQNFAMAQANALRMHMFNKTAGDMSTLAGEAVAVNVHKMTNAWTNTARSDPTSTQHLLDTADSSVDAVISSSPGLTGPAAAKVRGEVLQKTKEAIVKAGAIGAIESAADPEKAAATFAERYPDFINGQEIDQLAKAAKYYKRLDVSEARNARVMGDYEAKNQFHQAANELELSTIPQNPMERPTLPANYWQKIRELGKMPGAALEPGRIKTMVDIGNSITDRLSKPEPIGPVSHQTTIQLLNRIRATDETRLESNEAIYRAYGDGKLNTADYNFLQKEYQSIRTPEGQALAQDRAMFFKQYTGKIAGQTYDPVLGDPKLYAAEMDARRVESDLRRKGLDPHLAYDPTSTEYFLGNPARIQKWQSDMQQDLSTRAAQPKASVNLSDQKITGIEVQQLPPAEPAQRTAGHVYDTPKGKLKWTGTGWIKP